MGRKMTKSTGILVAGTTLGFALAIAGLAAPFNTAASAAADQQSADYAAARIGAAFAVVANATPESRLQAAEGQAAKGDLGVAPDCIAQAWPNIAADCLTTADGSQAPKVRFVTIGYQAEDATTVLMRVPSYDVAAR
jgi:hypothetical protein